MEYDLQSGDKFFVSHPTPITIAPSELVVAPGVIPLAIEFRLPMENLDKAWYEATRRFGPYNFHPERCEDWNLETGGDSDLGEPLVAPFNGIVLSDHDWGGGIGKVIQILGVMASNGALIVWAGWHLHEMLVIAGDIVDIGQRIGSIGNANGRYAAHLHEQMCVVNEWGIPSPVAFAADSRYAWQQPSHFYVNHGIEPALIARVTRYNNA